MPQCDNVGFHLAASLVEENEGNRTYPATVIRARSGKEIVRVSGMRRRYERPLREL